MIIQFLKMSPTNAKEEVSKASKQRILPNPMILESMFSKSAFNKSDK